MVLSVAGAAILCRARVEGHTLTLAIYILCRVCVKGHTLTLATSILCIVCVKGHTLTLAISARVMFLAPCVFMHALGMTSLCVSGFHAKPCCYSFQHGL